MLRSGMSTHPPEIGPVVLPIPLWDIVQWVLAGLAIQAVLLIVVIAIKLALGRGRRW